MGYLAMALAGTGLAVWGLYVRVRIKAAIGSFVSHDWTRQQQCRESRAGWEGPRWRFPSELGRG